MSEQLEKLKEGNRKFVANQPTAKDLAKARLETQNGQQPYAIVLTCSDSRVAPEHIFDAGIGEIFVVRTAGNVVDKIALGSIEYAAEHLRAPLLVVMGHEKCGAVKAAWEAAAVSGSESPVSEHATATEAHAHEEHSKNIAAIVKAISPAVAKAKKKNKGVEDAAVENVKAQIRAIMRKSPLCKKLVEEGKLKIVGAKYSLGSGAADLI